MEATQKSKIALPTGKGFVIVELKDLEYLECYGNYTWVYLTTGTRVLATRNLKGFEKDLSERDFFRIHQSYIVQISCISQISNEDGGYAIVKSNRKLPLARRRKHTFQQALAQYLLF